ncbi:MAG: hypothetical protein LBU92_03635, partial [Prevotellaceae bacterium]|nr:hypothetical protein [Prevotellaceae bacterium]
YELIIMQNQISITIDAVQEQAIVDKVNELSAVLPAGLVTLGETELSALPKMGDKSLAFVEKCLDSATKNPGVCPPFVDLEELRRDLAAYHALNRLHRVLGQVAAPVASSATVAGSDAYTAALAIYSMAREAARRGVAGAKDIHTDLSARFPGRGKAAKEA